MNLRHIALLLSFLATPAFAQSYLTPQQLDLTRLLSPPPTLGSPQQQSEMDELLRLEQLRTPERLAQARADVDENIFTMLGATIGVGFNQAALPLAAHLFDRLGDTEQALMKAPKQTFNRPRPFLSNPALHPAVHASHSGSYPSGHSTRSTVMGIVLAEMLPEYRDRIFARIGDYAQSRLIGGVHYPTDVIAGRVAGTAIDAVLFNDPTFLAEYLPARDEIRRALNLPSASH